MMRGVLLLAGLCGVLAGCSLGGGSGAGSSAQGGGRNWASTANRPLGVDRGTEKTLLAEWRAARFSCTGGPAGTGECSGTGEPSGCPYQPGAFATGEVLLSSMRRINPSIPATNNANATLSVSRFVFVLSDSNSAQLDIAMADAKGRYVHLVASGAGQPKLRVRPLGPF
jgi:hypothetical protein